MLHECWLSLLGSSESPTRHHSEGEALFRIWADEGGASAHGRLWFGNEIATLTSGLAVGSGRHEDKRRGARWLSTAGRGAGDWSRGRLHREQQDGQQKFGPRVTRPACFENCRGEATGG